MYVFYNWLIIVFCAYILYYFEVGYYISPQLSQYKCCSTQNDCCRSVLGNNAPQPLLPGCAFWNWVHMGGLRHKEDGDPSHSPPCYYIHLCSSVVHLESFDILPQPQGPEGSRAENIQVEFSSTRVKWGITKVAIASSLLLNRGILFS